MTLMNRIVAGAMVAAMVAAMSAGATLRASETEPPPLDAGPAELAALHADAVRAAEQRVRGALVQVRAIGAYRGLAREASGASTGVLLDPRWVVTSSFGMEARPEVMLVTLPGGATRSAAVVSIDHSRQTALLRLAEDAGVKAPSLEPRSDPRPGETAIGVGAAYSADEPNLSVGIVSAANRRQGRAVQTDAAVSPANYGGLLIDLHGRVLGVLCPAGQEGDPAGGAEWYDSGIGFAVPLEQVLARLPKMQQGVDIHNGHAGLTFGEGMEFVMPPVVKGLSPGAPADKAGLKEGDLITAVDGVGVATLKQLRNALGPRDAGEEVVLSIQRGDEPIEAALTLVAASELPTPPKPSGPKLLDRLKDQMPKPK